MAEKDDDIYDDPHDDPKISQWAKDESKRTGANIYGLEGWIRSHRPGGLAANPLKFPKPKTNKSAKPDPNSSGMAAADLAEEAAQKLNDLEANEIS